MSRSPGIWPAFNMASNCCTSSRLLALAMASYVVWRNRVKGACTHAHTHTHTHTHPDSSHFLRRRSSRLRWRRREGARGSTRNKRLCLLVFRFPSTESLPGLFSLLKRSTPSHVYTFSRYNSQATHGGPKLTFCLILLKSRTLSCGILCMT